jgi:hypothetical protein
MAPVVFVLVSILALLLTVAALLSHLLLLGRLTPALSSGRPNRALRPVPGTDRWASRPRCDRTIGVPPTGGHPAHTSMVHERCTPR